nr:ComEC/Rec2 family competence protein [Erythrobacter sp.]
MGDGTQGSEAAGAAARHSSARPWQTRPGLSSAGEAAKTGGFGGLGSAALARAERFLAEAGFDRAPWLAVAFGSGILAWFGLPGPWHWSAAIGSGFLLALAALAIWPTGSAIAEERGHLRRASVALGLVFAAGIVVIWVRSEIVGAEPIERPMIERVQGYVLERQDQPAEDRARLTLAVRDAASGESRKIRINVPLDALAAAQVTGMVVEGAVVRMRVRLMPPASPMLPGAYDFARTAWFRGLAATGSLIGELELVEPASEGPGIARVQRALSKHVRQRVDGSAGTIAAAFASGDRGAIDRADEEAMRDAGLTHLLSISGLHVSAVIAAAYLAALKLFALFPAIALRVRLPVIAAGCGALAGIGYTLLTGGEVPTVRSCVAALLVLVALAMGRDALSLRMVAAAAFAVMLLWPESVIGPSFQMSFSAVLAIVALSTSAPVRAFLAARDEPWWQRMGRRVAMLFLTGLVIEIALMPIVLYHFHRAGLYGALANVVAIPLVTFISMPLIALGLLLDLVGIGAPVWWLVETSLDLLLGIAHVTAAQPGAVKLMPQMDGLTIALFSAGGLWLALWTGRARLLGFIPAAIATLMLIATPIPDVLVGREGRHVGITVDSADGARRLLSLRDTRSSYSRDNLLELASVTADPIPLAEWPGARCSRAFCFLEIERGGREWTLLMARNRDHIEERRLAAACAEADIVVADRFLPRSCRPRWLKADRKLLVKSGGLSIDLEYGRITSVAESQGEHGWWRGERE